MSYFELSFMMAYATNLDTNLGVGLCAFIIMTYVSNFLENIINPIVIIGKDD